MASRWRLGGLYDCPGVHVVTGSHGWQFSGAPPGQIRVHRDIAQAVAGTDIAQYYENCVTLCPTGRPAMQATRPGSESGRQCRCCSSLRLPDHDANNCSSYGDHRHRHGDDRAAGRQLGQLSDRPRAVRLAAAARAFKIVKITETQRLETVTFQIFKIDSSAWKLDPDRRLGPPGVSLRLA